MKEIQTIRAIALVAALLLSCTSLERPELVYPVEGEELLIANPTFIWHKVADARYYSISISANPDFSDAIDTLVFDDTSFVLTDTLGLNTEYFWKVYANNTQGGMSDASLIETFKVKAGVELLTPRTSDSTAWPVFSWEGYPGASTYVFQFSLYADFRNSILDTPLVEKTCQLTESLEPATYYWRVRALSAEDSISAWSKVRRLVSYRISASYFPVQLGSQMHYTLYHLEGKGEGWAPYALFDTTVNKSEDVTFTVSDSFRMEGRLYWVLSNEYLDIGDTFSQTSDSIFSPIYFLGMIYPSSEDEFLTPVKKPMEVIYDSSGITLTWVTGDRGLSGYDSIGVKRVMGEGVIRQVRFISDVPDTGDDIFNWLIDSLELR
ncbi:hypothetical protein GF359_07755 [candidate division WOR-3 bacterium]|uniref:Fibronectin type-III domain-containing protein n=1 Tax=candidate division WOR-3 bacterium TaxID=2052148 RepID=A0A9D5KBG8_UNCW3|nr:hypothetical protein [candidate division WOR-3 bacterium]MBD3365095.1 hypothetical protein [candidate division WOR-3 bacterium]